MNGPPSADRRSASRLPDPPCPSCRGVAVRATVRTSMVIYFRCEACGDIWHVLKPTTVPAEQRAAGAAASRP